MYTTKQKGFTIVELLIVIVVIAILAAISIVAFTGIQQRGRDTQRTSDVSNIVKALTAMTTDEADNGGTSGVWPETGADAKADLADYPSANLPAEIRDRIQDAATPAVGQSNDTFIYERCPSGTGATITHWKEAGDETTTQTAGTC